MEKQEAPIHNSPYSDEELEQFEKMLKDEREESEKNIEQFENRLGDMEGNIDDNSSSADHHIGNIGTNEDEREKFYTMIEKEKQKQEEINMALNRIDTGNFGICKITGNPIDKERLLVKPYAKYSMEAKQGDTSS